MTAVGTLPTSGRRVVTREPAGADELILLEDVGSPTETMLALAGSLVTGVENWLELPAVDLAAAALLIRRVWIGNTIRTDARCRAPGCGELIDIAFAIDAYLEHHRPRSFRGISECDTGWFELAGVDVRFRIPAVADVLAGPEIVERCVRPAASAGVVRRIERALEALAPSLAGELAGVCPVCGATVELRFEPIDYVLAELRDASTSLLGQVHELALAYHWSEPAILGLDRRRRHEYVELVRGELVA